LTREIAQADQEFEDETKTDETCQRLMTVPGVGPVTALCFVATVDEIARFGSAHSLESYVGLVPGEDSSSDRQRRTSITKAGAKRLRTALVQAAWVLRRQRPNDPIVRWNVAVELRRGKRIAVVALARKLAGVLYALWRNGTTYDPNHRP
jgi:transposase